LYNNGNDAGLSSNIFDLSFVENVLNGEGCQRKAPSKNCRIISPDTSKMLGSRLQILVLLCVLSIANATGLQKYHREEQMSNILRARKGKRVLLCQIHKVFRADDHLDPPSPPINSTITTLAPQFFTDQGSKRVKVTYGPFVVPSMDINNGMQNFEFASVKFGCKNCTVTYMEAGLEYPNGTYANANTSLWLHHIVLYNLNNLDTVCGTEEFGERFFASGNERSPVNICING
jgi:hypothetical protein